MAFIVEMSRVFDGEPEADYFACTSRRWNQMLELAKAAGWKPSGTVMDEGMAKRTADYHVHFRPDYEPDEWAYCKRLSNSDARGLGAALKSVAQSWTGHESIQGVFSDSYDAQTLVSLNAGLANAITSFSEFASGGGFAFAWDD